MSNSPTNDYYTRGPEDPEANGVLSHQSVYTAPTKAKRKSGMHCRLKSNTAVRMLLRTTSRREITMRKASILVVASMTAVLIAAVGLLAQSQESLFGTWKMNSAKSKYSPGPAPKSNI